MRSNNNHNLYVPAAEVTQLELRSEEVQDILGSIPHWTIRSGSAYLLFIIVLACTACWFIRFPDLIQAPVVLTTQTPPAMVVARDAGYLKLLVKDQQSVREGQYLGFINNGPDLTAGVESLRTALTTFKDSFRFPPFLQNYQSPAIITEGALQEAYHAFTRSITNYQFNARQQAYAKQSLQLSGDMKRYDQLAARQQEQSAIMANELQLAARLFERDSILYTQKVISGAEFEQKKREFLASQRAYKNTMSAIANTEIQKGQLKEKSVELSLQDEQTAKSLLMQVTQSLNELELQLEAWEKAHVLVAPASGNISLSGYWANDQYVKPAEEILSVIPANEHYLARARLPVAGSGKVKPGQKVNIKLKNYPFAEYGMLTGVIERMSLVPKEDHYTVTVKLQNGLKTSFGRTIDLRQEMAGTAEIITEDLRLLDRVFFSLRKIF